jgi:hypothetical protein
MLADAIAAQEDLVADLVDISEDVFKMSEEQKEFFSQEDSEN